MDQQGRHGPVGSWLFLTANHREWEEMLFNALDKTKKGTVISWFETTDSLQHMFYRYLDEKHPALKTGQAKMSADVIEDLYKK